MHLGHKLLLTQACLVTSEVLHIGITGDALLQKKAYSEFLEPFDTRKSRVLNFVSVLYPYLKIKVFELSDPIGVAGTNALIEACILTREVEKGGKMINDARQLNGLAAVDLLFVDMILADADSQEKNYSNKLSSTNIREYLSKQQQQFK